MNLSTLQKQKLIKTFPELGNFLEQQEIRNLLNGIKSQSDEQFKLFLSMLADRIKVLKGEKGNKGEKPVKGVDYWTENELNNIANYILKLSTPVKGKDYFDGKQGERGRDGRDGKDGKDGKDADVSHETPETIAKKLNTLKDGVDISVIKGGVSKKEVLDGMTRQDGRIKLIDQRWHGGGLSQVYHDTTLTGTGTSSNPLSVVGGGAGTWYQDEIVATGQTGTSFSLLHTPTTIVFLFLNGQYLVSGIDYTRSGKNITLTNPLISSDVLSANYS